MWQDKIKKNVIRKTRRDVFFGRSICQTIKKIDKIMFYKDELC